jgi:parallel beta-helix repeat protein
MVIVGCRIVGNARLGIGGGGNGITIADNVISDNGLTVGRRGFEAGGLKTIAHNVLITGNQIDGNGAPGVWTDGGATDVQIRNNKLTGNRFGIRVEISNNVSVERNAITTSQQQAVLVIASAGVVVTKNAILDDFGGVIVGGVGTYGPDGVHLGPVSVTDNTITDSGTTGLHQRPPPGTVIRFDGNHYVGEHLQWDGHGVSFTALQALGQEYHGTWVP